MFKKDFFSLFLNIDLNDINNFIDAKSLILTKSIKMKKMEKTITKLDATKVFKTNQIFNQMLKML